MCKTVMWNAMLTSFDGSNELMLYFVAFKQRIQCYHFIKYESISSLQQFQQFITNFQNLFSSQCGSSPLKPPITPLYSHHNLIPTLIQNKLHNLGSIRLTLMRLFHTELNLTILKTRVKKTFCKTFNSTYSPQIYIRYKQSTFTLENWQQIQDSIKSVQTRQTMYGIIGLQKLLHTNAYRQLSQRVIDCELMPYIINMLGQLEYPQMQCQALKVLSHLCYGSDKQCREIVECGGVSFIMEIVNDIQSEKSVIDVIRIFGNLAAEKTNYRDRLIYARAIEKLIGFTNVYSDSQSIKVIQEDVSWAIANICRGNLLPQYEMIKQGLSFLSQMLINDKLTHDKLSFQSTLWALSQHTEYFKSLCSPSQISNLLQKLGHTLISNSSEQQTITPAIRILLHLIELHPESSEKFVMNVWVKFINKNLKRTSNNIRLETLILAKSILGKYGNNEQVQFIFNIKVINKLVNKSFVELLMQVFTNNSVEAKITICEILKQMTESSQKLSILKLFHKSSVIKHLINSSKSYHKPLIIAAIDCLYNLLEINEKIVEETKENLLMDDFVNQKGPETIEQLQMHPDEQIYKKALQFLEMFFSTQEQAP